MTISARFQSAVSFARRRGDRVIESFCVRQKPDLCIGSQPVFKVGRQAVSGTAFLANSDYRRYLYDTLQAQAIDMETAAFAQVAYANRIPFIAFRSLSDLAGGGDASEVGAFFGSGLAERAQA